MAEAKKKPATVKEDKAAERQTKASNANGEFIAVIRVRGGRRIHVKMMTTLTLLNLNNQHNLVFIANKPSSLGMLMHVKDYVTWGIVRPEIKAEVEAKRTEKDANGKPKKVFRLSPPKGGFERKGIKKPYSIGGALGARGDGINTLIQKMV